MRNVRIRKYFFITVILSFLGLFGCSETEDGPLVTLNNFDANVSRISAEQFTNTAQEEIISAHQAFSVQQYLSNGDTDVNNVVSPFEWQQLVTMVATGARG